MEAILLAESRSHRRIHELEGLIEQFTSPREEIEASAELAWELRISHPERAETLAQTAIELAQTGKFEEELDNKGLAAALTALAFLQTHAGLLDIGVATGMRALSILGDSMPSQTTTRLWYSLSWGSFFLGDYPTAMEQALMALHQSDRLNLRIEKAWALDALGSIYGISKDFPNALKAHKESVHIFEEQNDVDGTLRALNNLAMTLYEMKDYAPALEYALLSLQLAQHWNRNHDMLNLSCTIAQISIDMGNLDQAEEYLRKASANAEVLESTYIYHAFVLMEWARLALKRDDAERARSYLFQALALAEKQDQKAEQAQCHKSLSEIYEGQGEYSEALRHYKAFHTLNDEVIGERATNRLSALTITHQIDTARQEAEIYRLKANQLQSDMEEQKRIQALLEILAKVDGLTSVANRRHFDERLTQEYARHSRTSSELSLILLDIDYFKDFNDTYGHLTGDDCLRQVAQVLKTHVSRTTDLVARFGGEEFACILPDTNADAAIQIADKIREAVFDLAIPHSSSNTASRVTISLGVVTAKTYTGGAPVDLIATADQQLYAAKAGGRNRVSASVLKTPLLLRRKELPLELVRLVWNEDFESGNAVIDSQHQSLFATVNQLLDLMSSRQSQQLTIPVLTDLLEHTGRHFLEEERILAELGYAELQQHAIEHGWLIRKGTDLLQKLKAETISIGEVVEFLSYEMVFQHMLQTDQKFFPLFRKEA